jgi:predicted Zn-ribbon and HTH transcriptional regulator
MGFPLTIEEHMLISRGQMTLWPTIVPTTDCRRCGREVEAKHIDSAGHCPSCAESRAISLAMLESRS